MIDLVKRRRVGIGLQGADCALDVKRCDAFDDLLARLPVGDQISDGHLLQLVTLGENLDLFALGDSAIVIHHFADHTDRRQPGEPAEINGGLGVA